MDGWMDKWMADTTTDVSIRGELKSEEKMAGI